MGRWARPRTSSSRHTGASGERCSRRRSSPRRVPGSRRRRSPSTVTTRRARRRSARPDRLDGGLDRLTLRERLVARIRASGPLTFAEFMEAALFDPDDGYYTTHASLGFEGDYVTSADLGPAFGRSLARGVADLWSLMGKPPAWDLVEAGAGRGVPLPGPLVAPQRQSRVCAPWGP